MTTRDSTSTAPLTAREVFMLVLEADKYPIKGNEDVPVSIGMMQDALEKARTAVLCSGDPPEFAQWLKALQKPDLTCNEQEEIIWALYDHFEPENT